MADIEANRELIRTAFDSWVNDGDSRPLFRLVDDDVTWTVIGSTTISGTYGSKAEFLSGAGNRLFEQLAEPIRAELVDVLADGDKVILQWRGTSRSKSGTPYNQTYCWVMTVRDGKVIEATAYLDTEMVSAMFA